MDPVAVIEATLSPIFLVSGAAIFLNFTQARLFRVIDRMRAVDEEYLRASEANRGALVRQHEHAVARAVILRNAILLEVLVVAFTVVTTLLLLVPSALDAGSAGQWPIWTFALALLAFATALLLVVYDAFLSVRYARESAAIPERG